MVYSSNFEGLFAFNENETNLAFVGPDGSAVDSNKSSIFFVGGFGDNKDFDTVFYDLYKAPLNKISFNIDSNWNGNNPYELLPHYQKITNYNTNYDNFNGLVDGGGDFDSVSPASVVSR